MTREPMRSETGFSKDAELGCEIVPSKSGITSLQGTRISFSEEAVGNFVYEIDSVRMLIEIVMNEAERREDNGRSEDVTNLTRRMLTLAMDRLDNLGGQIWSTVKS